MMGAAFSGVKEKVSGAFGGGKGKDRGKKKLKLTNIVESIDVGVPLRLAYDQWNEFNEFSTFMKKVDNAERTKEATKLNWKAQVFWSHRSWESTIVDQRPDERIIWHSKGQKGHVDGAITFRELRPKLTRIVVVLEYHPQGLFERTGNLWRAQGRRVRLELKHFARHAMITSVLKADEIEGWRGVIEDSEVVLDHEQALEQEKREQDEGSGEGEDSQAGEDGAQARPTKPRARAKPTTKVTRPTRTLTRPTTSATAPTTRSPTAPTTKVTTPTNLTRHRRRRPTTPMRATPMRATATAPTSTPPSPRAADGGRRPRRLPRNPARQQAAKTRQRGHRTARPAMPMPTSARTATDARAWCPPSAAAGGPALTSHSAAPRVRHEGEQEMTTAVQPGGGGGGGGSSSSGLADVIDTILDKGLVIDAYVRVSLVGIELVTIDARVVVASVDTYLRFAEAVNRLDISQEKEGLTDLVGDMTEDGAHGKTKGALDAAGEKIHDITSSGDDEEDERSERSHRSRRSR